MLRTICLLLAAATLLSADETAYQLFQAGRTLEKAGELTRAYVYYAQAATLEPKNKEYKWFAPGIGLIVDDEFKLVKHSAVK